jgi:hypothetical protein
LRKLVTSLVAAALLALGVVAAPAALAAVPGSRGPNNCQGYDVSHYQANDPPDRSGPFGSVVSGFAQDGRLVGFVRGAANCGNN